MESKPFYKSKTWWVSLGTMAAATIATALEADHQFIADHPRIAALAVSLLGVINMALRFATSSPVHVGEGPEAE